VTAIASRADRSNPRRLGLLQQVGQPLRAFLSTEAGSAGLLFAAVLAALVWANSPWSDSYVAFWSTEVSVRGGDAELSMDLRHWVTDGLMFFFFLVIGLEVRRELAMGELTDRRTMAVPGVAALGGMVMPAAIYLAINAGGEAEAAWGAVIGTDTAFMLGALVLIGAAHSTPLRVYLLTLSIFDDLVAVLVIVAFYAGDVDGSALLIAGGCLLVVFSLGRLRVWRAGPYVLAGLALWVATVDSGLHPAIGGMAMGLAISAYPPRREAVEHAAALAGAFRQSPMVELARSAKLSVSRALSPNERIQAALHPWTSYAIVPLFALANAGVDLRDGVVADAVSSPVTCGMVAGLVGGKLVGVAGSTFAAARLGFGRLPRGVGSGQVLAAAALSGIGFTVSLLIVDISIRDPVLREEAKVGVLVAGVAATLVGWSLFRLAALLGERTEPPDVLDPPVDPARDHIRGPVDAPLILVEFADFECHFCGQATGVVDVLRRRFGDELRYVFRHLPLTDTHEHAELAAEASEAAAAQGRFWDYHDILFQHQDELEFEDLLGYAGDLDLDVERFARELEHGVHSDRVLQDVVSAEASGARATPTFFVGGRRHAGRHDAEMLAAAIARSAGREAYSEQP
jgi:Na+/H+ antiporter NhaA